MKNTHSAYPEYDQRARGYGEKYEFVQEVVDLLRPTDDLSPTTFRNHEVPS